MAQEQCPKCGADRVRRSASLLQHLLRLISGSPKRYCPACRKRWAVADN